MLGYSHTTRAKDDYIKATFAKPGKIADILEVFFRAGVNAVMGMYGTQVLRDAVKEAEDRTGVKAIRISTPSLPWNARTGAEGFDKGEVAKLLDEHASWGAQFLMPHQGTTDTMVDRCTRQIRGMGAVCAMIRERGMIPGLSTHMPESITYADESGLDVETYVSIYNAAGFLMQVEVDWTARIIRDAKKPVMTIKPMAAGRIPPFQAMNFVWNTIRPQDMVTVGTMSPGEAEELIELSTGILERREAEVVLQETRSKASIKSAKK